MGDTLAGIIILLNVDQGVVVNTIAPSAFATDNVEM